MDFSSKKELFEYLEAQDEKIATLEKMVSERNEEPKEPEKDPESEEPKATENDGDGKVSEKELDELESFLDSY